MDVIFLFYGLAFLALGFVIVVRYEPGSSLNLAGLLWLLAAFGFVHGLVEWTDLWRVVHGDTPFLAALRPFALLASFVLLFEFGRLLVLRCLSARAKQGRGAWLLGPWIYLPLAGLFLAAVAESAHLLAAVAVWSRYLFGFVGAWLAGAGCYLYRRKRIDGDEDASAAVSRAWYLASAAFFAYGIFGGLVVTSHDFPSVVSEEAFRVAAALPVQLFRAACAILIVVAFGRIMGMFAEERRQKLRYAVDVGQYSLLRFQESKARYEALLKAVPQGVVGLDAAGNFSFANEPALATLGYRFDEVAGQPFHALAHHTTAMGQPHGADACPIHLTLRDGETRRVDADLFWRKNRTWFPASYTVVPVMRNEKVSGAVILMRNLADNA
ncbi:MAG TPA: PAS domain-containing protein [Rhodocyclaceae bacterium]